MDRSSNVMPRTSAAARLALMVWNTFSLPCGNRDAGMDFCLLPGPVTSLLCPAGAPPREPGLERSPNTVWRIVRPLYSNKLPPDYIKIHYYQAIMRTALSWQGHAVLNFPLASLGLRLLPPWWGKVGMGGRSAV